MRNNLKGKLFWIGCRQSAVLLIRNSRKNGNGDRRCRDVEQGFVANQDPWFCGWTQSPYQDSSSRPPPTPPCPTSLLISSSHYPLPSLLNRFAFRESPAQTPASTQTPCAHTYVNPSAVTCLVLVTSQLMGNPVRLKMGALRTRGEGWRRHWHVKPS